MVACEIIFLCIENLKETSKRFPVLILLNTEINLQHTHAHPNSISNKEQTRQHLPPELVLVSFTRGPWFFLFCFPWQPSTCWSDLRVWPQIPYLSQNTPPNLGPGHWNGHDAQKLLQFLWKFLSSVIEGSGRVFNFLL